MLCICIIERKRGEDDIARFPSSALLQHYCTQKKSLDVEPWIMVKNFSYTHFLLCSDNDIVPTVAPTYPTPALTFPAPGRNHPPPTTPSAVKTTTLSRVAPSAGQAFTSRPFKRPERPPRLWYILIISAPLVILIGRLFFYAGKTHCAAHRTFRYLSFAQFA
jgi:hypothetical protein